MPEEKKIYKPLEKLFADEDPTLEKISGVFKRASRKNVDTHPEEVQKLQEVCARAKLTRDEYKQLNKALQSCIESLVSRKKEDITRGYEELLSYAYYQERSL